MSSGVFVTIALMLTAICAVPMARAVSLKGVVEKGGTTSIQPLADVPVTLYEATPTLPNIVGQSRTDAFGRFAIPSSVDTSSSIFYVNADLGAGVEFVTVLGSSLPSETTINELTTVAASYSMAQFFKTGVISGNPFSLKIGAGMNDNLVSPATGESSSVLLSSPNADETISLRSTRSLANLLAACVSDQSITGSLFKLTTPDGGRAPSNTAQALANLARNPGQSVESIYRLTTLQNAYSPSLTRVPDAWTVVVKVNDSGDDGNLFGGPANLVFDSKGYAWVTNNVVQGKTTSSNAVMVLQPNGKPANGAGGTPRSPITSGGILGGGFGITIDHHGSVWEGNFGWGPANSQNDPTPNGNGSVSQFTASGTAISGPQAYQGGPVRAQGMASDSKGNIWICSYGTDEVFVFLHGDPNNSVSFKQYAGSEPFDIAIAADGTAWVSNGGGFNGKYPSSIAKYALVNGALEQHFLVRLGGALKGLSLDSQGNAWVASQKDSKIYGIRPDGSQIGAFGGGGINGPWDATVDGDDNIWVTNFGPLALDSNFTSGRLTKLCGVRTEGCSPGAKLGDPISPPTGYTMPSAGSPVLLHNGELLYGRYGLPSFAPMMRQTASVIDQAGNIWSINNWKPSFAIDILSNPGGDGILIFVGLAAPPTENALMRSSPAF